MTKPRLTCLGMLTVVYSDTHHGNVNLSQLFAWLLKVASLVSPAPAVSLKGVRLVVSSQVPLWRERVFVTSKDRIRAHSHQEIRRIRLFRKKTNFL
jgi:hypothetical protein